MASHAYKFHESPPIGSKVVKGFLCTYLRCFNVRHFGMAEATRLNICHRGYLQLYHVSPKFHESPPIGSKVVKGFLCTHLRCFNVRHFGMAEATRLKFAIEVIFNCITCLPNFMRVHLLVQNLLRDFFAPTSDVSTSAIL
jgi:hypothetical protein